MEETTENPPALTLYKKSVVCNTEKIGTVTNTMLQATTQVRFPVQNRITPLNERMFSVYTEGTFNHQLLAGSDNKMDIAENKNKNKTNITC